MPPIGNILIVHVLDETLLLNNSERSPVSFDLFVNRISSSLLACPYLEIRSNLETYVRTYGGLCLTNITANGFNVVIRTGAVYYDNNDNDNISVPIS